MYMCTCASQFEYPVYDYSHAVFHTVGGLPHPGIAQQRQSQPVMANLGIGGSIAADGPPAAAHSAPVGGFRVQKSFQGDVGIHNVKWVAPAHPLYSIMSKNTHVQYIYMQ